MTSANGTVTKKRYPVHTLARYPRTNMWLVLLLQTRLWLYRKLAL